MQHVDVKKLSTTPTAVDGATFAVDEVRNTMSQHRGGPAANT